MFEQGREYKRSELHDRYGGSRQSGISTPSEHPFIFLFTSDSGELYGYQDGPRSDGTYEYTGQGQVGDMEFKLGNKAIRDHERNGKTLHLFKKSRKSYVRYVGEMRYTSHRFVENVPDRNGRSRRAIVFLLEPV